ncbi:uncharacterized protein LOC142327250 [Lycorma delicatula]|uniref:uncharacterized protein LOC142327250 n=1 Tax=Lycorma delicatula TaxID=130591 RepID=UPI003F51A91E
MAAKFYLVLILAVAILQVASLLKPPSFEKKLIPEIPQINVLEQEIPKLFTKTAKEDKPDENPLKSGLITLAVRDLLSTVDDAKYDGNAEKYESPNLDVSRLQKRNMAEIQVKKKEVKKNTLKTQKSGLSIPKPKVPSMKIPKVPSMKIPKVPSMKIPKVPSMKIPKVPSMKIPKVPSMKKPHLPSIKKPSVPKMSLPSAPKMGKINVGMKSKSIKKEQKIQKNHLR